VTVTSLLMLKRVGIDEAFVQQEEEGQEVEFQRAFTLELLLGIAFAVVVAVVAPLLAVIYGDDRLVALTLATAYLPIAFALQAPTWVFFRRMDFARQRGLQAVVPVVTFLVTVPLAATGFGVWSLVVGPLAGNIAGGLVAIAVSPYRLRLRYDRDTARRYLRFSGPIFVTAVAVLVVSQGQVLAFTLHDGLAAAGFITLAVTFTRYVDRADAIVTSTIYPAICAIQNRTTQLTELFVKSNRATLMWVLPFAAGVILFAPDLVSFVLGHRWRPAVVLLQGLAAATAVQQLGFKLVLVLPRAQPDGPPGDRGRRGRRGVRRARRARAAGLGKRGLRVGPAGRHADRSRRAHALHPRDAAGRAAARPGRPRGGADRARRRGRRGRAPRAVGRPPLGRSGDRGAARVRRRARARHLAVSRGG